MLSAAEVRGREFKRLGRAAAALSDLYDDTDIARELEVSRMTVGGWWNGALPKPSLLQRFAEATGMDADELVRWLHMGGPRPTWPPLQQDAATSGLREGVRRDRDRRQREVPGAPAPSPARRSPDSGAERE